MKRIVSLALSLILAIGLITPLSFDEVLEKPGVGVVKVLGAEEEYTVTTVEDSSAINYFSEYDEEIDKTLALKVKGVNKYDYANAVLEQMNELRSSLGIKALTMDEELLSVAMQRASEISIYYSHTRPDDTSCFSFNVPWRAIGENIAIGYISPDDVMNGWTNSSGHYANMINSNFNAVGVGCFEASDGTLCWVQYFTGGTTPNKAQKSGSVDTTHTVKAKNKNLDLSMASSKYDLSTAKKGDAITFGVINRNIEFDYQTQDVSASFNFKSLDSDVIEINNDGVGKVTGEGTVEIKATLKDDIQFSLENEITIGHNHTYSHYYSNNDATCASDGTKTAFCDYPNCRETDTVKESGTRLDHSYIWTTVKQATVYSEGKKQKECSVCGRVAKTTTIDQLKCSKPALKSIENTQYGVLTKWSKVKGADSYRVYRKTSKSEWEYLDSTKNVYFTDRTAKSGTKYYYAVRARNEAGNSSLSSSFSKYYLADPTLNAPSSSSKGIGLRWSKVEGAEGYMVYRKTADGSYKRITTEEGISNVTFRDTTAEKGVKYYYKVKAYYSKTYSAYSNTKSVTDKY